jgi:hypothetical protein
VPLSIDPDSLPLLQKDHEAPPVLLSALSLKTPELTPISKSKRAQARFADALASLIPPNFSTDASLTNEASLPAYAPVPIPATLADPPQTSPYIPLNKCTWKPPPELHDARAALVDLMSMLHPKRVPKGLDGQPGKAAKPFECDDFSYRRFTAMEMFLRTYTHVNLLERLPWTAASLRVSYMHGFADTFATNLREWSRAYINDRLLPMNVYGKWTPSMLNDGDLAHEIFEHLQSIGQYVQAQHIVEFLKDSEVQKRHGLKHGICLTTAKNWMTTMGYRWGKTPKGLSSPLCV